MPPQRRCDSLAGKADFGRDGVDGQMLVQVPLGQVTGHVGEAKRADRRQPARVVPPGVLPSHRIVGGRVDAGEVA